MTEIEARHKKQLATMRGWLDGKGFYKALDALEFVRQMEQGFRKDKETPKFNHQLSVAQLLGTLSANFLFPEDTLAAAFLHDVLEDHPEAITRQGLGTRFGERVASAVWHLSKKMGGLTKTYEMYFSEMAEDPIASVVKLADRGHNLQTMQGVFSLAKQRSYVSELDEWFFPLIKNSRRAFPQQYAAYENLKIILLIQKGLLEALAGAQQT